MKKILDRVLRGIQSAETVCSVVILAFMVAIIGLQIILRYFFGRPMSWAEELTSLLLIYLSFLTADMVYKGKGHIAIDYVVKLFGNRTQAIVAIGVHLLTGIFLVIIFQQSIPLIQRQSGHTTAAALPLTKSYWTLPVPIVFFSMFLTTLQMLLEEIERLRGTSP